MRQHPSLSLLRPTTLSSIMPSPLSSSSATAKPRKPSSSSSSAGHHHSHHSHNPLSLCHRHSATATLDLLILILVLFSGTFLLTSYFSYIFNSLSLLLLSHSSLFYHSPLSAALGFVSAFSLAAVAFALRSRRRRRRCDNPSCKGLAKALEFDLQLQTEDCLKSGGPNDVVDKLPWKGGTEGNPDYECLRAELRKMAPPNGRAVLLFRAKCGCPVAKLVGWGPKKGRKHKKALSNVAINGDHH